MNPYSTGLALAFALLAAGCSNPSLCDADDDGVDGFACGGDDCNDDDPTVYPSADELCDDIDHNCDLWLHVDAVDGALVYEDGDGDGFGDPTTEQLACQAAWPQTAVSDDCDDTDPDINPDTVWYADTDEDGLGDPDNTTLSCEQPDGFIANNQDADDTDPNIGGCWVDIAVGRDHSCAIKTDGSVSCWGSDAFGQSSPPLGNDFVQVSAGYRNTCALDGSTQQLSCWGSNSSGKSTPPSSMFDSVSCGLNVCCGLLSSGTNNVACWGDDTYGETAPPSGTFSGVSAGGGRHVCGVLTSGEIICWGSDDPFQGAGQSPTDAPSGSFTDLNSGHYYSCAIADDGSGDCWGANNYGQGDVPPGEWQEIKAGTVHTCGVTVGDELSCWGSDLYGRTDSPPEPTTRVDVNQLHSCAIGTDGSIRCWGFGEMGQLEAPPC